MTRLLMAICLVSALGQTRDAPRPSRTGTAAIGGVVTDEATGKPVRRAMVMINGAELGAGRSVLSDDHGRFVVADLPASSYSITASKPGWLTTYYGAKRSWRPPGTPMVVAEGQRVTNLAVRLVHGAAISGRVVDPAGRPLAGLRPIVLEFRTLNGQRRLSQVVISAASFLNTTDDRGEFRMWGFPPGSYVVGVMAGFTGAPNFRATTAAELQWARHPPGPGAAVTTAPRPASAQTYAPVYHPGVADAAAATTITLAAGEDKGGVDTVVRPVFTSTVSGAVALPDGQPARGARVTLIGESGSAIVNTIDETTTAVATAPTGRFIIPAVRPGRYTVSVRAASAPPPAPAADTRIIASGGLPMPSNTTLDLWATTTIVTDGQAIDGLALVLQPGVVIAGRVVIENSGGRAAPDLTRTRIQMMPANGVLTSLTATNAYLANAAADGAFAFAGVSPDRYLMTGFVSAAGTSLMLKSIAIGGRDVTDAGFDVQDAAVGDAVITFTDKVAEISGTLFDGAGRPAPEYWVFVFPADRNAWTQQSRRFRPPVRPASDGTFRVSLLPPGAYLIAALTEFEDQAYLDTAFIEQLVPQAIKITIAEGEKRVQDIKIK